MDEDVLKEYRLPRKKDVDSRHDLLDDVVMIETMPKRVDVKALATVVYIPRVGPAVVNPNGLEDSSHGLLSRPIGKTSELSEHHCVIFR